MWGFKNNFSNVLRKILWGLKNQLQMMLMVKMSCICCCQESISKIETEEFIYPLLITEKPLFSQIRNQSLYNIKFYTL